MKRLFVAIKVNPEEQFLQCYERFKQQLYSSRITWVHPSVMHMTLKFLGNTENEMVPHICNVLEKVAESNFEFDFTLDHLGIFGSSYLPRVIWLGSSKPEHMAALGNNVIDHFHEAGFLRDRQNFVPHLSLGRIKDTGNKKYFQSIMDKYRNNLQQSIRVQKIILYQSVLRSSGPIYQQINTFKLKIEV